MQAVPLAFFNSLSVGRGSCQAAFFFLLLVAGFTGASAAPPDLPREFRGAWVATIYNLDWPSKAGLPAAAQKTQLIGILDTAAAAGLNAIILQVRPACDALYESPIEPWSPVLMGTMGASPGYDPLAFAVEEAHRRGLELHAWFNPFRAQSNYKNQVSSSHVTRRKPEWVRRYGNYLWLDPGLPEVRQYSLDVILDVVRRYDIDGIHIDDYFYPYPVEGASGFPDAATYKRYGQGSLDDWRRANINTFVSSLYKGIKQHKPWVKFGISPFGIWRPGVPEGTTAGLNAYSQLYGDSRLWLANGWLDYFAPQLYWPINSPGQSFARLAPWWASQNAKRRHLWPGLAVDRIGKDRNASEIASQIALLRKIGGSASGHILWSESHFRSNKGGIRSLLAESVYRGPALIPPSPWLDSSIPPTPTIRSMTQDGRLLAEVSNVNSSTRFLLLQTRQGSSWSAKILDGRMRRLAIDLADEAYLAAISRTGITGQPVRIK